MVIFFIHFTVCSDRPNGSGKVDESVKISSSQHLKNCKRQCRRFFIRSSDFVFTGDTIFKENQGDIIFCIPTKFLYQKEINKIMNNVHVPVNFH